MNAGTHESPYQTEAFQGSVRFRFELFHRSNDRTESGVGLDSDSGSLHFLFLQKNYLIKSKKLSVLPLQGPIFTYNFLNILLKILKCRGIMGKKDKHKHKPL